MSTEIPADFQQLVDAEANLRNIHDLLSRIEFSGQDATRVHLAFTFIKTNHDDILAQMQEHPFEQQQENADAS